MALFKQNKRLSDLPAPPTPDFEISKPDFEEDFPKYTPSIGNFDDIKQKKASSMNESAPKKTMMEEESFRPSGPVFIKIEKYEEALNDINFAREKINEIEQLLDGLKRVRREEDKELETWEESLNQIKEKLAMVDENLFEV